ncbi:non-ribosomal peptide synthase [filamentous cyanobacterium CCP3]|nr:non-ribosomal peptide synthase [filamentous cyanobacterium CCP3]
MNVSGLIDQLTQQGVQVWTDDDGKLKIQSPKGVLTSELQSELVARKAEILEFLLQKNSPTETCLPGHQGLSLQTIGRLIGGYGRGETFNSPIINPSVMAQKLKVTFRPLPSNYTNDRIIHFRKDLEAKLTASGVTVVPWEQATQDSEYEITLPTLNLKRTIKSKAVKSNINAMIDVERHPSGLGKAKVCIAENLYQLYSRVWLRGRKLSVSKIAQFISWAEENIHDLQDPTNTQVIVLTDLDESFIDPELSYQKKIPIGVNTLVKTFSEIVVGVSESRLSILNMNLSDSVFPAEAIDNFVTKSLIPKIYVPILPLPLSRFEVSEYDPAQSDYAASIVKLGNALAPTGLLPAGFKINDVVKRQSHRDIIDWMAKGRTGVSFGFVAYAEPPQYVGEREVSDQVWATFNPVSGFSFDELRQTAQGRRYLRLQTTDGWRYHQIPDIWLVSSRSGSNKTNLDLTTDVVRIGLTDRLHFQLPQNTNPSVTDVKPSYDLYVMVSLALGAALFAPRLIESGMPMVHFHGYPAKEWFAASHEYCAGVENPSVPCGTYESGVFNFLGIQRMVERHGSDIALASLVEPDHGTNIVAYDMDYLLQRLNQGVEQDMIELGGKYFPSLRTMAMAG